MMKGIYLVAILYVAILGVIAFNESPVADISKCPETHPRNETFFVPHESDCTKFYSCHMGVKGEPLDCPLMDKNGNRLHFNPKLQVCDWPWSAGCQVSSSTPSSSFPTSITTPSSSPTPTTPTSTTPSPTTPSPTTPSPTTPSPTTPSPTTPSPTTPSPTTPSSTTPSSTPSSSSPTTPSLTSCESDGRIHMIPHKTMCDYYYSCLDGRTDPIPHKCDRNLLFNPVLRVCDYPENVNCSNIPPNEDIVPSTSRSLITTLTPSNPSSSSPLFPSMSTKSVDPSVDPSAGVCVPNGKRYKVPHETLCNYYYWCVNGIKGTQPVRCESYLLFNPVIGECDFPENVDCSDRSTPSRGTTITTTPTTTTKKSPTTTTTESPTTTSTTESPTTTSTTESPTTTSTTESPTTTSTTESPTTTPGPKKPREHCPPKGSPEKARIAHPCLCNQYYECIDGEKILDTCPIGKHFDYVREVCDWAAIVKCIRPIPTFDIPFEYANNIDDNTTCAPEGRTFRHEADCSAYYQCFKGEKTLRHCIEGLHFNMTIQMCDYPLKSCDLDRPIIKLDTCPPSDSIQNVFLSHECNCSQYYECVGRQQVLRFCPNGLHFDKVRQICNDPTEAQCIVHTTSTTPRTPISTISPTKATDKSRITCPPKESFESARLPHPCLCNQYYECVEGEKILQTCPMGMYFDDAKEVCNWASKVECIQPFSSHDILNGDTKCSPDGGTFPHEFSCTEYYLCSEGEKIMKSCPEGLHFNVSIHMCDYPKKKCDLITPMPTIILDVCPPAGSTEKVLLPHECECTQYYECIDGKQVVRYCSDDQYYDQVRQICNDPTEVKCANLASTISTKWSNISDSDSRCYDEDSETPYEYDCRFYYKCSNGEKILKTCPRNLYFNPKLRACDFPENVACDAGSANVPTQVPSKCPTTTGTTKIPHETDCNLYYVCEDGVSTLKRCHSPELVFNPILKVCDFPENYICNVTRASNDFEGLDKMTMTQNDPSTCIGTCPEEDPPYAVLLPNDDCKKFCMCSGGVAWIQSCPEPLYFDSIQKVCKRKKDAVCGKRSFSEDDAFTIHNITDDDNSSQPLSKTNTEKRGIYNLESNYFDNLDPSTCIGTCPEEDPEYAVLLPNDDCKKFCLCSNGLAYVQPCPEPLYFDSVNMVCKRKKDAVCAVRSFGRSLMFSKLFNEDDLEASLNEDYNERRIYNNPWYRRHFYDNVDPFTCIGICPEENSDAVLLAHGDCRKFCICNNGLAYVQQCPESLYFHSVDKVCRHRKHTVCAITENYEGDSMEYLSDDSNEERRRYNYLRHRPPFHSFSPSICIGICSEDDSIYTVLYPNTDCRKFCLCSNGVTWVQSCPEPFYFDSIHKICKRKKDAVCAFSRNHAVVIDKKVNDERIEFLSEESDERKTYNSWCRLHSYNHDTSTCIGTCSDEDYNNIILLPNLNCKKFCICSRGMAWVHSCPDSFYFDSVDKICKLNAICAINMFNRNRPFIFNKDVEENNSMTPLSKEKNHERKKRDDIWTKLFSAHQSFNNLDPSTCIGTCPEEDPEYAVLLPNDDCKKFCMCSGGVAWVQSCPEPLYFDSVQKVCKRKKDAVCGVRSSQDNILTIANDNDNSLKTPTDEKNERGSYDNLDPSTCIGTCPEEDPEYAVLLSNDDCKKFCMCSGGVAWVQSCPEPLYFDSVQKVCKQKKDAVCGVRSSQDNILTIANDNDNSLKTPTDEKNERESYDNLDPSTCIGTCPEEDPEYAVLLPNDDCKKFCMCSGGVAWVQLCPEPLYFDSVQKVCKRKKDAVCGVWSFGQDNTFMVAKVVDNDNSLKTPTDENNERGTYDNLDPSTCIGTCPEEDPEYAVLLPNDDCKKFCMCSGVAWVQSCPEPLYFDSVQRVCKRKKDAVCGVRSSQDNILTIANANDNSLKTPTDENNERGTYDNLDPSTCIGTCPEEDPEYAVLLPNDDCKKFCMCSGGVAWVQSCPEPLYFDSVQKVCKRKKDAVCGVRSFGQDNTFMVAKVADNDNSLENPTDENNERGTYDNLDPSACIGTCPEEDPEYAVLLPNDDCKKFCMCSGGVAWVQSCPEPLYFDSIQKVCKRKKDAVCGVRSR